MIPRYYRHEFTIDPLADILWDPYGDEDAQIFDAGVVFEMNVFRNVVFCELEKINGIDVVPGSPIFDRINYDELKNRCQRERDLLLFEWHREYCERKKQG